jgi:hypothetical protein
MTQSVGYAHSRIQSWTAGAFLTLLTISLAALFSVTRLNAQSQNSISGTVTDASGAVIPGAKVTITNNLTGVQTPAVTSSEGTFVVVGLIPGQYTVVVDVTGFKRAQTTVTVEVAKTSDVNFQMQPGSTTQTVEVTASALTLETTTPTIGATLEPELVQTAPLEINSLARQIDSFIYLAPGVTGSANSHNINGGVTYENEVDFNGVPVAFVDYSGNQTYMNPPYEAVNEFRVNSSTFDARYGLGQGAVTFNMASGTNQLHGDGFDILRNQWFDSSGFFPTRFSAAGAPLIPVDQQNDFGFTVGGPVYLPKIYNGKNRTFFYFSSDWFRQNLAQNQIGTVPTAAMKQGDFSNFVDSSGNQIPIYDPQTGLPFPNNMIPTARFSNLANSILPLIPDPNRTGLDGGNLSNESPAVPSVSIKQNLWSYTLDHNISSEQSIHFSEWRDYVTEPFLTSAPVVPLSNELQSAYKNSNQNNSFLLNYVKTVNPHLVATVGADWIGYVTNEQNAKMGVSFAGVTGSTTFPLVTFDGQNAPTNWGVNGGAYLECCSGGMTMIDNHRVGTVIVNNWLWSKGRHTMNFGFQYRHTYQDILPCQFCSGTFNFSQRSTSIPNTNDPNFGSYGSSFASFLLGQADAGIRLFSNELYMRSKEVGPYFQDDVKINDRLTVDIGLRYDIMVPFTERNDNIIYVNPTAPDPGAGNIPGAATKLGNCTGCAGVNRADIHFRNFQPRLGFAYKLSNKMVIRSGFYLTFLDGGAYEYGTAQSASFMSDLLDGEFLRQSPGTNHPGYGSWDASPLPEPQPTPFSPSIGNAGVIFDYPLNKVGVAPYDAAWNFGIQRELPWNMFLMVSYVGNRANHMPTTLSLNDQPVPSVLQYGSLLGELVTSPDAVAAGIKIPYPEFPAQFGGSATVEQALEPFPQFGGYFPVYEHNGTALYNTVQVQAEKRFSNGLSYLATLTMGRLTANTAIGSAPFSPNGLNAFNTRPEYVPSYLDQVYNQKVAMSYDLPIGLGKKFLNSRGIVSRLVGGWTFSSILTYAGGSPFGATNSYNPLLVNSFDRPNIVPAVQLKTFNYNISKPYLLGGNTPPPVQFTTDAFQNTGPWQIGDSRRAYAALRTPPLRDENLDLIKTFKFNERLSAVIRLDYFNAFNRTQLQSPDTNSLDSTFGEIINLSSQISNRQGQATFRLEF